MRYFSTRGGVSAVSFSEAVLDGLAPDGGLYLPESWPRLEPGEIAALRGLPYADVAFRIMRPFIGEEIAETELRGMIEAAYASFHHPAVAPLRQIEPDLWMLELFHGPTLAFKDVAMQFLARLMDHLLTERGERRTIVGATSGDTGGAALAAFRGRNNIDCIFLYPDGRVSEFQRRQMTAIDGANCHAVAIAGDFDACQALVKEMFTDIGFRDRIRLSAVNSINWGRIIAQTVYFFTAAVALGAPEREIAFCVPTGNFGNVYAGYVAARMGLPISRLVIATNENDILARTLANGDHRPGPVRATVTPSMDIQISSNFERLLFDAADGDAERVATLMRGLKEEGGYDLPPDMLEWIVKRFSAVRVDQAETRATMAWLSRETGAICDPHSAVAVSGARTNRVSGVATVALATADPSKFPEVVRESTGVLASPPVWAQIDPTMEERVAELPRELAAVEAFVGSVADR